MALERFLVPPSGIEVYESEAGEGVGFVFGFGMRQLKSAHAAAP